MDPGAVHRQIILVAPENELNLPTFCVAAENRFKRHVQIGLKDDCSKSFLLPGKVSRVKNIALFVPAKQVVLFLGFGFPGIAEGIKEQAFPRLDLLACDSLSLRPEHVVKGKHPVLFNLPVVPFQRVQVVQFGAILKFSRNVNVGLN